MCGELLSHGFRGRTPIVLETREARLKGALEVWKIHYCEGEFEKCVRYQRACSAESTPANLLPNGDLLNLPFPKQD